MSKLIGLVGHCGPDGFMLRSAVKYAVADSNVKMLNSTAELQRGLEEGAVLLLVNRVLDSTYDHELGCDLIRDLKVSHPGVATMLISNFSDAQATAEAAGALPGFGKSEVGSAKMKQRLAAALNQTAAT
ncbi:MAG TPA: hypothetical protein VGB55_15690 [Tepidisphaeraceae bacterium]|jgi:hypothetical protein